MSGDLVSLRLFLASANEPHHGLWREAATQASVPIEFEAADSAAAKAALRRGGVDICVLDGELDAADRASVIKAARTAKPAPMLFATAPRGSARPADVDGVVTKPADAIDARKALETCIRAKMPTPVLIVDDSDTMRGIVRKILVASRFELDIHEAEDGSAALDRLRSGNIGVVFLDSAMPGLNGADILLGIKRQSPHVAIVMMSSSMQRGVSGRPHLSGALGFLKKPFYPADVDAVLDRYFGLREAT